MALCSLVIIGSGNRSSPVQHQSVNWTNANWLSLGSQVTNLSKIWIKMYKIFIQQKAFAITVCEISAILFWPHCVKLTISICLLQAEVKFGFSRRCDSMSPVHSAAGSKFKVRDRGHRAHHQGHHSTMAVSLYERYAVEQGSKFPVAR